MAIKEIIETLKFTLIERKGILLLCAIVLISTVAARVLSRSGEKKVIEIEEALELPDEVDHDQRRSRLMEIYND